METIKILLVDDEERYLKTTGKLLEKKGHEVLTAQSGRQALEKLKSNPVHVVVLDVKMPEMDGIDTLRAIKILDPMVEVIMLTGHATMDSAIEGLRSGACDYLMKPADIDDILEKAMDAFKKRRLLEEKIKGAHEKKIAAPD